ncbi:MAG: T9SS type A sorting domain-containing protein [Saprospiraceae bacterium]|nr:T9SS type A sorting domain-containing protein [Saprospiraceae bacterium]
MKKLYSLYLFIAIFFFCVFNASVPEPSNPPTANTGAPGETTCQQNNCHGGGNYTGTSELVGLPDTIIANTTYEVTILNKSDTAIRTGFQLTALDDGHAFVGTLTEIPNERVNVARDNVTKRFYARQLQAKFFNVNGEAAWKFQYTAPSSVPNDSIIFYYTALLANGNGDRLGDNVLKLKKTYHFRLPVANDNSTELLRDIQVFNNGAEIIFLGNQNAIIHSIFMNDVNGKLILQKDQIERNQLATGKLATGIYFLNFKVEDKKFSKKIYIN